MALGWLWWRAWVPFGAVVAAAVCLAGVALGDIGLHFVWQAWHLATSTCILRGRRGTYGTGLALVARLGPIWRRCRSAHAHFGMFKSPSRRPGDLVQAGLLWRHFGSVAERSKEEERTAVLPAFATPRCTPVTRTAVLLAHPCSFRLSGSRTQRRARHHSS